MDNSDVHAAVHDHEVYLKDGRLDAGQPLLLNCETIKFIKLCYLDLSHAEFYSCIFDGVYFENVTLDMARFDDCLFSSCSFINVTFVGTIISSSYFTDCTFINSDLDEVRKHDFGYSNLQIRNLDPSACSSIRMACPEEGSFIAWKKVAFKVPCIKDLYGDEYEIRYALVKLQIPADAKRSSAGSRKCRCQYADVLDIEDIENGVKLTRVENCDHPITYAVGERVYPDSFDENRWNECSNGIHFFMSKQDALEYLIYLF